MRHFTAISHKLLMIFLCSKPVLRPDLCIKDISLSELAAFMWYHCYRPLVYSVWWKSRCKDALTRQRSGTLDGNIGRAAVDVVE